MKKYCVYKKKAKKKESITAFKKYINIIHTHGMLSADGH